MNRLETAADYAYCADLNVPERARNEDDWGIIEKELRKLGLTKFVVLNTREDEWNFEPSETFNGTVALAELPTASYPSTIVARAQRKHCSNWEGYWAP